MVLQGKAVALLRIELAWEPMNQAVVSLGLSALRRADCCFAADSALGCYCLAVKIGAYFRVLSQTRD